MLKIARNIQGPLSNRSRSSKGSNTFREIDSQEKQPILQNFVNTFTANIPDKIKNIFGKKRIFPNLDEGQSVLGEKTPNSLNDIDRNKDKFFSGSLYPHPFKFNENRFNPIGSRRHSSGVILQSQGTTNREKKPLSSFCDSKQAQALNNIQNISPQSLKGSLLEIEKEILDSVRIKPANTITVVKKSVYNNPFDSFTSRESLPTYPSVKRLNLTKNESSIDFSDLNLSNETNSNKQFGLAYASSIQSARRYSGSSHNTSIFQEEFKIMQKSKNNLDDVNVKSSFSSTLNVGSREVREYSLNLSKVYRHPSFGNSAEHTPYFPTTTNSPLTEELQSSKGQSTCENNRKEVRKFF